MQTFFDNSLGNDAAATGLVRGGTLELVLTSTAPLVGMVPQLAPNARSASGKTCRA